MGAVERVRALHFRRPWSVWGDFTHFGQTEFPDLCDHCRRAYPCETIQALEAEDEAPAAVWKRPLRHKECVEAWPECESMAYDPRCCRFPKSCSAEMTQEEIERGMEGV